MNSHPSTSAIFNYPIMVAASMTSTLNATNDAVLAFGDYQQQVGDERTLLYQNRLRSEIADLEWIARVGTYHGTICAYISSMMIPIAYCSNLPHFPSIMSTPFGSLSITAIVFNATAAMLSYMTIRKARNIPAEFPLRRTYQTPEPSWVPHYMHYIRGRCRNHFVLTFVLGTCCVLFQIILFLRLQKIAELDALRAQIAHYTSLLDAASLRNHRITELTSLSWGPHPLHSTSTIVTLKATM